ncbi:MAG: aminopeptidase [Solirubrobacteraceae bacterium]
MTTSTSDSSAETIDTERYTTALAELVVRQGANVQPGQVVALASEPGKESLTRAIAQAAYQAGAKFVDLTIFDVYLKRARALYAEKDTLTYVPPWLGERALALGEHRCARIGLSGPVAPRALEGVDPELIALDALPRVPEAMKILNDQTTNWSIVPCPTTEWAALVYPELEPSAALERLWSEVAHVCRLDEPDPTAAWDSRLSYLLKVAGKLNDLDLDGVHFQGPGTDLKIGLLKSSTWLAANMKTVDGIVHQPNIPTEEVFTTPDPARVDGHVASTKPLFTSGTTITGIKVRFEGGRAVQIDADEGVDVLRGIAARDEGAARLGEVALVDREGRIGPLGTVFFDTLLDENAASHIALGQAYQVGVSAQEDHARMNASEVHVDFMIGGDDVSVSGVRQDGGEIPLLRGGLWQL